MVRAKGWVDVHPLGEKDQVLQLISVETARKVDALTGHNQHLPTQ